MIERASMFSRQRGWSGGRLLGILSKYCTVDVTQTEQVVGEVLGKCNSYVFFQLPEKKIFTNGGCNLFHSIASYLSYDFDFFHHDLIILSNIKLRKSKGTLLLLSQETRL